MKNSLIETLSKFDCPSADGVNTFLVSKAAKSAGLTVSLSGLGADEIFGGYSSFRNYIKVSKLSKLRFFQNPVTLSTQSF